MSGRRIGPGMAVVVVDSLGRRFDAVATSWPMLRVPGARRDLQGFPGVWVRLAIGGEPTFWPLAEVRAR